MSNIKFNEEMNFEYLVASEVAPNIRRMVANNGNAMTFKGTNSYILGTGKVAIIDPGPELLEHREALFAELNDEEVTHILLTHTHRDHSDGIEALQKETGAKTVGFGQRDKAQLEENWPVSPDYIDWDFAPDLEMKDGDTLAGNDWAVEAIFTPGHAPDHLCFAMKDQDVLFSGDHVMGWNTSVVAPPEGHMGDYMASLEKLMKRDDTVFFPGHGGRVTTPQRVVKAYLVHRTWREAAVLKCVKEGKQQVVDIVDTVYPDSIDGPVGLRNACLYSVLGHLEYLAEKGVISSSETDMRPSVDARFEHS